MCVFEAINPCLDGNNGGCHGDGDCIHTGPNKVRGCIKTDHSNSQQTNQAQFLSEYKVSEGFKVNIIKIKLQQNKGNTTRHYVL